MSNYTAPEYDPGPMMLSHAAGYTPPRAQGQGALTVPGRKYVPSGPSPRLRFYTMMRDHGYASDVIRDLWSARVQAGLTHVVVPHRAALAAPVPPRPTRSTPAPAPSARTAPPAPARQLSAKGRFYEAARDTGYTQSEINRAWNRAAAEDERGKHIARVEAERAASPYAQPYAEGHALRVRMGLAASAPQYADSTGRLVLGASTSTAPRDSVRKESLHTAADAPAGTVARRSGAQHDPAELRRRMGVDVMESTAIISTATRLTLGASIPAVRGAAGPDAASRAARVRAWALGAADDYAAPPVAPEGDARG